MDDPDYVLRAKQYQRDYYLRNQEKKRKYARDYHQTNKDQINAGRRKGDARKAHGIVCDTKKEYNRRYHVEVRAELLFRERIAALQKVSGTLRPVCIKCGFDDVRALCINHINGGGRKENMHRGPHEFKRAILEGARTTDDLNVLCCNCNILYEYERGRARLPRNWLDVLAEMNRGHSVPT